MWLLLLVTLGAANAAIAFGLVRTERTRDLALWGLVLKVCFLPIFLVSLVVFALIGSQFSLRPEALPLEFALLTPYAVLSYALMIVTSCYGFAAIIRARDEQVISPETAKKYKRWHAIPIADPGLPRSGSTCSCADSIAVLWRALRTPNPPFPPRHPIGQGAVYDDAVAEEHAIIVEIG